jgi:hypothetical protein
VAGKKRQPETTKKRDESGSARSEAVDEIAATIERELEESLGPDATFEERQDKAFEIMRKVLWKRADDDLRGAVTDADEVKVGGRKYQRLRQASSATYFRRWGDHHVEEPLYREIGIHNGQTIKPIELRVGIIEHMTPEMARVVGAFSAECGSRALERTLRAVGLVPPSRAFLADRVTQMGDEIAASASDLEAAARRTELVPRNVVSVSCGLDRMSVRMSEPVADENSSPRRWRTKPYARRPPAPKQFHYRKAWVGSTSVYDADGRCYRSNCLMGDRSTWAMFIKLMS